MVMGAVGGVIGLGVLGAYLGGEAVQAATVRAKVEKIQSAEVYGYSQAAMAEAAGGLDPSALAIANRHDPYGISGSAQRDRQAELLMARLDYASRRTVAGPTPARPFELAKALDQSRDLDCLTRAAYYEARGEGADGMRAVVQVVLNRVRHPAFPNSICGVVYQGSNRATGCQFSFTCNGSMRGRVNRVAWDRAQDIASKALSGRVYSAVGNATHFHTSQVSPRWRAQLVQVAQVGDHLFYRFGGRTGRSSAFSVEPEVSATAPETRLIAAKLLAEPEVESGPVPYSEIASQAAAPGHRASEAPVAATPVRLNTPTATTSAHPVSS